MLRAWLFRMCNMFRNASLLRMCQMYNVCLQSKSLLNLLPNTAKVLNSGDRLLARAAARPARRRLGAPLLVYNKASAAVEHVATHCAAHKATSCSVTRRRTAHGYAATPRAARPAGSTLTSRAGRAIIAAGRCAWGLGAPVRRVNWRCNVKCIPCVRIVCAIYPKSLSTLQPAA